MKERYRDSAALDDELIIWISCVGAEKHPESAGQSPGTDKTIVKYYYINVINYFDKSCKQTAPCGYFIYSQIQIECLKYVQIKWLI